ncbi:hypothetical protein HOLleu_16266 [Holothuria leucospilota]|uniref:PH domain-containing protein n=1 Tax=Holothuria leucospilota TaxID=206669 RepID=A0A9Q1C5T3_HOLLE|nr:hypothetical protein HOLleu_16266 [Holothuria leucospilota]
MATRTSFNVIYKGWLKKGTKDDTKKKGFLRSSTRWKKKYCALCSMSENGVDIAYLCIYDKEVGTITEVSREFLKLWPHYRVFKKHDPSGKNHVFEVKAPEETYRLMAESVTIMDLWVFYIQIQTKMHRNFVGESFEVTPVESDSVRRIGARGSRCLIHLSKWGLTLALKRTKVVVAQWPLKCIREFESSETGLFSFDAGRNSPMGQAHYSFTTNPTEDGKMYDILDAYTTQVMQARAGGPAGAPDYQEVTEEEVTKDYESLRLATFGLLPVKSRSREAQLPTLPTPSPRSMAVPVPGRPEEYNHLKRHPSETGKKPRVEEVKPPKSPLRRNNSQPQLSPRAPPVPLATHPVLGGKLQRSSSSEVLATVIQDAQEYTDMSPGNTLERKKEPSAKRGVPVKVPPRKPYAKGPPKSVTPSNTLLSKSPYYNTLVGSYENCPLVSPSPRNAFAFTNEGFVSSPGSLPISPPKFGTNQAGAAHSSGLYSPQPITHTYYEQGLVAKEIQPPPHAFTLGSLQNPSAQLDSAVLYAKVNKNFRKSLSADNLLDLQEIRERRTSVASQMSVPHRMSGVSVGSFSDRMSIASNRMSNVSVSLEGSSPLIGSLDLAGLPRAIPSWMGLRDLPSVPQNSGSPQDSNLYCKMPNLSAGASNVGGAASVGSQASSTGKHYEDIDKMKKMYEDMSRRKSALIQSDREAVQNAVIVRSDSTSSNSRNIPPPLPPDRDVAIVTQIPQVSPGSYENTDPVPLRNGAKGSLRRAQSTGDLLDTYGDDSDSISLGSPPNVGQLTLMKKFKSIPNLKEGLFEIQKSLSGSRSNSSNSLNTKAESSSKGSPVTWTLRKLKHHNAAKKKQYAKEEQAAVAEAEQPQARAPSSPEEPRDSWQEKKPKERAFKSKQKDSKGKSKEKGKAFSGKDVKIVASGKTRTFTRQAAFSSSTSLDTISVSSQMSGRELPATPSLDLPNIREGVYEDIDDDDDIANQRRFSESLHVRQERNRAHGERRNTAPSVNPPNQSKVSFQAKI